MSSPAPRTISFPLTESPPSTPVKAFPLVTVASTTGRAQLGEGLTRIVGLTVHCGRLRTPEPQAARARDRVPELARDHIEWGLRRPDLHGTQDRQLV